MRKPIALTLIFFTTLSVGIGIIWSYYFFKSVSVREFIPASSNIVESLPNNTLDKMRVEPHRIFPCNDAGSFKHELNFREKAIALGIVNSRILCGELPKYPSNLKAKKISSEVLVWITINEAGEVSAAKFLRGNKLFSKSAQKAAYQTKFSPILIGGKIRRAFGNLIYEFDREGKVKLKETD